MTSLYNKLFRNKKNNANKLNETVAVNDTAAYNTNKPAKKGVSFGSKSFNGDTFANKSRHRQNIENDFDHEQNFIPNRKRFGRFNDYEKQLNMSQQDLNDELEEENNLLAEDEINKLREALYRSKHKEKRNRELCKSMQYRIDRIELRELEMERDNEKLRKQIHDLLWKNDGLLSELQRTRYQQNVLIEKIQQNTPSTSSVGSLGAKEMLLGLDGSSNISDCIPEHEKLETTDLEKTLDPPYL
uniref:BZIP domain-containing protein n=1 Tax=Rhabditophanes sp. KR3021 TaxID=114890 RepID=A0AC35TK42_9BILA